MANLWHQYQRRYFDYEANMAQLQLVLLAATAVLDDFPRKLPPEMREELAETFESAGGALLRAAEAAKRASGTSEAATFSASPFSITALRLLISQYASTGDAKEKADFDSVVAGVQIVMALAHLDGLLSDSLRTVCRREPRILSRDKKIGWRTVMSLGSWDALIEHLESAFARVHVFHGNPTAQSEGLRRCAAFARASAGAEQKRKSRSFPPRHVYFRNAKQRRAGARGA